MTDQTAQATITFGSAYEQNMYLSLQKAKITFEYQVPFFGSRRERGSTVVDFVIYGQGLPQPVALYVDGPYWHSNRKGKSIEDMLKRARLEKAGYRVMVIGGESETAAGCAKWIKDNL